MIKLYLAACDKQNEHDVGAALAHFALCDTYSLDAELKKDVRGKPYFDGIDVHVSISHSNGLCIAAISDSEIGVDIERVCGDKERLVRLADRYFTAEESDHVRANPGELFYHIWCAKESYIKYTGEGFSRALNSFSVLNSDICFSHFDTLGYHITVCSLEYTDTPPIFIDAAELQL